MLLCFILLNMLNALYLMFLLKCILQMWTFFRPSFFPPFPSPVPSFLSSPSPFFSLFAFFTAVLRCLLLLPLHSPHLGNVNTHSRKSGAQCLDKVGTFQSLSLFPQNTWACLVSSMDWRMSLQIHSLYVGYVKIFKPKNL